MNIATFFRSARRLAIVLLALSASGVAALLLLMVPSAAYAQLHGEAPTNRSLIRGHMVPLLRNHKPLHSENANRTLQLSIALKLRNEAQLDALLAAQNDPQSPLYHHYLTPQQFTEQFGPTPETVNRVVTYLRSQGLRVNGVSPNRTLISASGSVSQIEQAFAITLADYQVGNRTVYAPTSEPSVPAQLGGLILNIAGLDNVALYHPLGLQRLSSSQVPHTGPGGGYTPSELRTAYDMNSLINGGSNGSGQTVAIFELDGYRASDVNAYLSYYGLGSAKYSNVLVDGATNTAGSGAIEVELDMEVVSAIAPGANQKIYIGPNTNTGVNDTYNRIVTDNLAKVVSISWGECEAAAGTSELATLDNIFKQGAAQGQAFFAASGDSGAYDCDNSSLAVDSPADDPYVVGVGGTHLVTGSGGTYSSESAWSNPNDTQRSPYGSGGGGGISSYFARPSYQTGPNLTNANRMVPDVSADADPATGYSVYCTVTAAGCSSSGWLTVGGTSAAAPLWAGVAADVNQYLTSQGKATLGSASATIYRLYNTAQTYSAYHDITSGNNLYYSATTGYDLATGIGSPDVWNFARDVAGTSGGGGGGGGTTTQLLSNPGFENGSTPWQESSSGGYEIVDPTNPHTGSYSAYLCGYNGCNDQIWQTVTLPSTTTKVVLSYWLYISTQESGSTCYDYFYARIRTSSGSTITTVQTRCNANASGWTQYTFDLTSALSSYYGQQIQVYFQGTTDSSLVTNFFVDDVALNDTHS
jgi:subtilase family serine protease